jgi:hypothetical protein
MNIDKSLIESMSSAQVLFATSFLENVFVKNKTNISIEDSAKLNIIYTLIKASKKDIMKSTLFFALTTQSQETLFNLLTFNNQTLLLLQTKTLTLTMNLYNSLEPSLQNQFMVECFKKNQPLFKNIKQKLRPNISIHQGIIIEKTKINESLSSSYISKLIHLITDQDTTIVQTKEFSLSLQKILAEKDLELLTNNFFSYFSKLKLKLDSKETFVTYLKFFEISVPLIVLHPSNIDTLDSIIEQFLLSLNTLTSQDWIIKLLNQVPPFILNKCCYEIHNFEKIKNASKRNIYCRYNNLLKENLNKDYATNIKEAINQV